MWGLERRPCLCACTHRLCYDLRARTCTCTCPCPRKHRARAVAFSPVARSISLSRPAGPPHFHVTLPCAADSTQPAAALHPPACDPLVHHASPDGLDSVLVSSFSVRTGRSRSTESAFVICNALRLVGPHRKPTCPGSLQSQLRRWLSTSVVLSTVDIW